jgi:hypothetical protein
MNGVIIYICDISFSAPPFVSRSITPPLTETKPPEVNSYADAVKSAVKNGQSAENSSKGKFYLSLLFCLKINVHVNVFYFCVSKLSTII